MKSRVVVIGGGFGGLYAARHLRGADVEVTLIDRRNFHLFQPLLYQVATGGLSPEDISSPLRAILNGNRNTKVLLDEVLDIDPHLNQVHLAGRSLEYDYLIVATGSRHHYFGKPEWENNAPGLKSVEDALEIRNRILGAFEAAEKETDPTRRRALLRFVLVGAGPTGVELAGALAELSKYTMKHDFRSVNPGEAEILLLEGMDRILPSYPESLSRKAKRELEGLGVKVRTGVKVSQLREGCVELSAEGRKERLETHTVMWAAGVKASGLAGVLARRAGLMTDRQGRLMVRPDLSIPGFPRVFAIGDLAAFSTGEGETLPGVASVAMQQGRHAARNILRQVRGEPTVPFRYRDPGSMAVIGRHAAVADLGFLRLSGFIAWFLWVGVHIMYLIEFGNKMVVMAQWAWNYLTRKNGARLIGRQKEIQAISAAEKFEKPA